jgi:3-deoxy-D-manno-octulosonic-acid transferase
LELLYTALLYIIQPLVWLRLLLRSRKAPAYRKRWAERYGFCRNKVAPDGILLHSVSVGETLAAIPRWFAPCATATLSADHRHHHDADRL